MEKYPSFNESFCNTPEYRALHRYCPKCGCLSFGTTLLCCYGDMDINTATCGNCGHKCSVHERIATRVENPCECKFCQRGPMKGW